jgi:hypothetical protein
MPKYVIKLIQAQDIVVLTECGFHHIVAHINHYFNLYKEELV